MKMKEVIDGVSKLYREQLEKKSDVREELISVSQALLEADYTKGENISLAEYNRLTDKKKHLENAMDMLDQYCNGISCVREYLMDLGFDTEVG